MIHTKQLQAVCGRCGGAIRCSAELIGTQTQCPHCGEQAELILAMPPPEASAPRNLVVWSVCAIVILLFCLIVCLVGLRWAERHQHHPKAPAGPAPESPAKQAK